MRPEEKSQDKVASVESKMVPSKENGQSPAATTQSDESDLFYEDSENLKKLCNFLLSGEGPRVREALLLEKRVIYLKGRLLIIFQCTIHNNNKFKIAINQLVPSNEMHETYVSPHILRKYFLLFPLSSFTKQEKNWSTFFMSPKRERNGPKICPDSKVDKKLSWFAKNCANNSSF